MKNILKLLRILVLITAIPALIYSSIFFFNSFKERHKPYKIAAILPLTGTKANYGTDIKNGLELAKEEINKSGGVKGNSLEIDYEDDQAEPKLAVSATEKIIRSGDFSVIFGPWASSCALAMAPIAEKNKMPVLAEAQSPQIRDAGDYIFRIQPDSRYYLKYLVPYVFETLKIRKVAILYVNNDYGSDQASYFSESFKKLGGEVVFYDGYSQNNTDFKTQLTKLKTLKPDGVFIPAYTEAGYILKQSHEMGFSPQFIGSAPIENPDVITIAGSAANGVVYPHHFDPETNDTLAINFIHNYEMKYNPKKVEGFSALAYDGLYIIKLLLEQCDNKECIKNNFYKIKYKGATGVSSFDDHGDVIKPITIRHIVNQEFRTIKTSEILPSYQ